MPGMLGMIAFWLYYWLLSKKIDPMDLLIIGHHGRGHHRRVLRRAGVRARPIICPKGKRRPIAVAVFLTS